MKAQELFKAGKLDEAVQALTAELRDNPTDVKRRTFLFELLCFAGEYDRAERQLEALGRENREAELGSVIYRSALHAERMRQAMFQKKEYPKPEPGVSASSSVTGILNGKPFEKISDADPRIGANLELYVAGSYVWLPYALLQSVEMQPPKRLRDLFWAPIKVRTSEAYKGRELGEVYTPVLSPSSWQNADNNVRLGRVTAWEEDDAGEQIPVGQKMMLVDGEEVPLLEVRRLEFANAQAAS